LLLLLLGRGTSEETPGLLRLLLLLLLSTCIPEQASSRLRLSCRITKQTRSCRLRLSGRVPEHIARGGLLGSCRVTKQTTGCRLLLLLSAPPWRWRLGAGTTKQVSSGAWLGSRRSKQPASTGSGLLGRSASEETTILWLMLLGRGTSEETPTLLWLLLLGTCSPKQIPGRLSRRVPE
jgi:hypothetical protein